MVTNMLGPSPSPSPPSRSTARRFFDALADRSALPPGEPTDDSEAARFSATDGGDTTAAAAAATGDATVVVIAAAAAPPPAAETGPVCASNDAAAGAVGTDVGGASAAAVAAAAGTGAGCGSHDHGWPPHCARAHCSQSTRGVKHSHGSGCLPSATGSSHAATPTGVVDGAAWWMTTPSDGEAVSIANAGAVASEGVVSTETPFAAAGCMNVHTKDMEEGDLRELATALSASTTAVVAEAKGTTR